MLYDHNAASIVLGAIFNNPSLCINDKYPLNKIDFYDKSIKEGERSHQILFVASQQLALMGVLEINGVDIGEFMKSYPDQLDCLEENQYLDFVDFAKELGGDNNFEYYYKIVRKFSLLRECKKNGFDISDLYDEDESNIDAISLEDITNYFEGKLAKISKKFNTTKRLVEYRAGENFLENKERFKEAPMIGNSFQSPYFNAIFRGLYGLILRSGNSSSGKTTLSVGDLCKTSALEYWDSEQECWVKNKSRCGPGLFINSEMDLETELDPIFIAWISNVPRSHILDGKYEPGEEERVERAAEILIESEIFLVDNPDFTIHSLTSTIADYAINYGVKTVCFDYVSSNVFIQSEVSSKSKVTQREDMILLALTDALKQISRKYNVQILSGTQLNARDNEINGVNESLLMGGKGQVRKCDSCMIMLPPTKKELELTETYIRKKGFGEHLKPNSVSHIVKGRASKYPKYIKVFQHIDLGTGRSYDLFVTDRDNNLIKVDKLYIEVKENDG